MNTPQTAFGFCERVSIVFMLFPLIQIREGPRALLGLRWPYLSQQKPCVVMEMARLYVRAHQKEGAPQPEQSSWEGAAEKQTLAPAQGHLPESSPNETDSFESLRSVWGN